MMRHFVLCLALSAIIMRFVSDPLTPTFAPQNLANIHLGALK
jgi:hypothetical protein